MTRLLGLTVLIYLVWLICIFRIDSFFVVGGGGGKSNLGQIPPHRLKNGWPWKNKFSFFSHFPFSTFCFCCFSPSNSGREGATPPLGNYFVWLIRIFLIDSFFCFFGGGRQIQWDTDSSPPLPTHVIKKERKDYFPLFFPICLLAPFFTCSFNSWWGGHCPGNN